MVDCLVWWGDGGITGDECAAGTKKHPENQGAFINVSAFFADIQKADNCRCKHDVYKQFEKEVTAYQYQNHKFSHIIAKSCLGCPDCNRLHKECKASQQEHTGIDHRADNRRNGCCEVGVDFRCLLIASSCQ